jgi:hypothetical protein
MGFRSVPQTMYLGIGTGIKPLFSLVVINLVSKVAPTAVEQREKYNQSIKKGWPQTDLSPLAVQFSAEALH